MVRRQVLKMIYNGEWTVIFVTDPDIGKHVLNPYRVYHKNWVQVRDEWKTQRKLVAKYADFYSCLCFLKEKVAPGDVHGA